VLHDVFRYVAYPYRGRRKHSSVREFVVGCFIERRVDLDVSGGKRVNETGEREKEELLRILTLVDFRPPSVEPYLALFPDVRLLEGLFQTENDRDGTVVDKTFLREGRAEIADEVRFPRRMVMQLLERPEFVGYVHIVFSDELVLRATR